MPIPYPVSKTVISTTQWGIPITDAVNKNADDITKAGKGFIARKNVGATSGGWTAGFEWGSATMITVPTTPARRYTYVYRLGLSPTSAPGSNTYMGINLKIGGVSNGAVVAPGFIHSWVTNNQAFSNDTLNICGSFDDFTVAPGSVIGITLYIGLGTYTMFGNSYAVLYDIGSA